MLLEWKGLIKILLHLLSLSIVLWDTAEFCLKLAYKEIPIARIFLDILRTAKKLSILKNNHPKTETTNNKTPCSKGVSSCGCSQGSCKLNFNANYFFYSKTNFQALVAYYTGFILFFSQTQGSAPAMFQAEGRAGWLL